LLFPLPKRAGGVEVSLPRAFANIFNREKAGENSMAIRPLHDRIIVKRIDPERTSAGGIVIPDTAGEKPDQGEVISVGTGKLLDNGEVRPLAVKKGDRVLFGKYAGQAVKIDGQELLVVREDDVIGIIEN
jgi:chaperonin GroES